MYYLSGGGKEQKRGLEYIYQHVEASFLYIPERGKSLVLDISGSVDSLDDRDLYLTLTLYMNSPDIHLNFCSLSRRTLSQLSELLEIPNFHTIINDFKEKLKKAEEKVMEDMKKIENAHKTDFENW